MVTNKPVLRLATCEDATLLRMALTEAIERRTRDAIKHDDVNPAALQRLLRLREDVEILIATHIRGPW